MCRTRYNTSRPVINIKTIKPDGGVPASYEHLDPDYHYVKT